MPEGAHLTVLSKCTLYHIPTGNRMGSGMGSCSTKESKYAYRQAKRVCPACGKDAIVRGKPEYGGGWLCFKKKDGCGSKFAENDALITSQPVGRVPNPDLHDVHNTILKMANKRALVAAVLNVTAASDLLTQDLEDAPPQPEKLTETATIIPLVPPVPREEARAATCRSRWRARSPQRPSTSGSWPSSEAKTAKSLQAVLEGLHGPGALAHVVSGRAGAVD